MVGRRSFFPGLVCGEPLRGKAEFQSVQALRAVGVILVVIFHSLGMWTERVIHNPAHPYWQNGSAGVDLFFVISGFVMVVATRSLTTQPDGWWIFVKRRVRRIVPLYWGLTSLKLCAMLLIPAMMLHTAPGIANIVCSYLFIPARTLGGTIHPVLPVGWTLNYEMLFYTLFALALFLQAGLLRFLVPVLVSLAIVGLIRADDWPAFTTLADEIVLEFLFGICAAFAILRGWRLTLPVALAVLALASVALLTDPLGPVIGVAHGFGRQDLRTITFGIPALAIVFASASIEGWARRILPRVVLVTGDASYSIYLAHGFALPVVGILLAHLHPPAAHTALAAVGLGMAGSLIAGFMTYRVIERPLLKLWRKESKPPRELALAPAVAGEAEDRTVQIP